MSLNDSVCTSIPKANCLNKRWEPDYRSWRNETCLHPAGLVCKTRTPGSNVFEAI